jgi:hypothetical protein
MTIVQINENESKKDALMMIRNIGCQNQMNLGLTLLMTDATLTHVIAGMTLQGKTP